MKKILVTGGLGYVGGRMVQHLLMADPEISIDISSRRKADVNTIFNTDRVSLVDTEELNSTDISLSYNYAAIVHLAAANEIDAVQNTAQSIEVNILNSYILLQKAIAASVQRFIYFSTAHVYGSPLQGIISEEIWPKPLHPYAITHKGFEDFLWAAHQKKEIEGIIIRLSNSFGAPFTVDVNRWTLLVNDLCRQGVINRKMILKSSGTQLRDFVTLNDVSRALHHLLLVPGDKLGDGIFNLGGNYAVSVYDMAVLIRDRFSQQFHMNIPIERPEPAASEVIQPFAYQSNRLAASGFKWTNDIHNEIDHLILFCIKHFS